MMRKRDIRARRRFVKGSGRRGQFAWGYEIPERFVDRLLMVQADIATPEDGRKVTIRARAAESLAMSSRTPIGMVKSTRVAKA